jgi:hypothetical protein
LAVAIFAVRMDNLPKEITIATGAEGRRIQWLMISINH